MPSHAFWLVTSALLSNGGCASQTIWLLSFQPFTGGVWDGGISTRIGAEIMLREINANPNLLPGLDLRIAWQDSLCDGSVGENMYLNNLAWQRYDVFAPGKAIDQLDADRDGVITTADVEPFKRVWNSSLVAPGPVGLLGCACSGPTIAFARMSPAFRMPHVSNAATFASLSDRSAFPNFFRTAMPDTLSTPAWLAITKDLGVSSVIAAVSELGFAATAEAFVASAAEHSVQLRGNDFDSEVSGFRGLKVKESSMASIAATATDLILYQQRIVVLLVYAKTARLVLCEAYKRGFLNAVYMVFGWLAFGWWDVHDTECTPTQLADMAVGYLGAQQQFFRTDTATRLSCSSSMTAQHFQDEFWRLQNTTPGDYTMQPAGFVPRRYAATTADAVCMFAQALHEVMFARGGALSELVERTASGYSAMVDAFAKTDFEGVGGRISFPPNSGDPLGTVLLQQLQRSGGSLKIVDIATFRQSLSYLGRDPLVFQFPGERFSVGRAGESSIGANLSQFLTCTDDLVLDMGTNRCVPCPTNTTFVERENTCLCKPGFYETESSGCEPCPGGTFSSSAGTRSCQLCGPGTFSSPGLDKCGFCPRGSFSNSSGLEACFSCPSMQTTLDIASESRGACLCSTGSYNDGSFPDGDERSLCLPCKEGMSCPAGSDLRGYQPQQAARYPVVPLLEPGYWSSLDEPLSVFSCHDDVRCPGQRVPGSPCAENFEKERCGACKAGYAQYGSSCAPCSARTAQVLVFPVLPVLLLCVMICAIYVWDGTPYARWGSWMKGTAATFFITLNHYHIVNIIQAMNVIPNRSVSDTLRSVSVFSDLASAFSPECSNISSFMGQLVLKSHAPAFALLVYAAVWLISMVVGLRFISLRMEPNRLLSGYFSIVLTFFTSVAGMSFTIFKCTVNPNGLYTLVQDRSITCYEDQWLGMLAVGVLAVFVWCLGFALLLSHAIYVAPTRFESIAFQTRWAFLFIRYRPDVHWWALVIIVKGVVLNFGSLFISFGVGQIYWIVAVLIIYTYLLVVFWPWRHNINNYMDFYVHLCLFWTCMLAVWFSRDAAVLNVRGQEVMGEQMLKASITSAAAPFLPVVAALWWKDRSRRARQRRDVEAKAIFDILERFGSADSNHALEFLGELTEHDFAIMSKTKDMLLTELGHKKSRGGYSSRSVYSSGSCVSVLQPSAAGASVAAALGDGEAQLGSPRPCDLARDGNEPGPDGKLVREAGGEATDSMNASCEEDENIIFTV